MMLPVLNKDLLPLKIHYFFKYGGLAFFTFLPVVARQKGIPAVAVGLIWMVTPLASCSINLITSTLADKLKIYRTMFLGGMVSLTISFISYFLLPNIVTPVTIPRGNLTSFHCTDLSSSSLAMCSNRTPEFLKSWECIQEPEEEDRVCVMECLGEDGMANQTYVFRDLNLNFTSKLSRSYDICDEEECTVISSSSSYCGGERRNATCSYYCEVKLTSVMELTNRVEFWLIFVSLIIIYGSNSTTTTMADTICFQLLGKERRHLYGRQRLFGSIGWGIVGLTGGILVDLFSHGTGERTNYMPVVVLASIFLTLNLVASFRIPFKVHDREKLKASHVGRAVCTFPFFIYMMTVVVGGLNMGMVWTFVFILMEDIAGKSFGHIKLLQGLMLFVGCFLGEVPSLFLSAVVIKKLGSSVTFVISLAAMAIRVFLYSVVKNPWLFVPIDLLHGASFGLFYPNMISSASHMSPPGAMATVQSIVKNTFIAGTSLGSLVGGVLVSSVGGSNAFFYLGIFNTIFTVVFALTQYLMHTFCQPAGGPVEYHVPGRVDVDGEPEEQRSVCDLQVCTPYPDLPDIELTDPIEYYDDEMK